MRRRDFIKSVLIAPIAFVAIRPLLALDGRWTYHARWEKGLEHCSMSTPDPTLIGRYEKYFDAKWTRTYWYTERRR